MAWTSQVRLDEDKTDVGYATATWNSGEADEFSYTRRVKVNAASGQAFVADALAALVARDEKLAAEGPLATILEDWLNG